MPFAPRLWLIVSAFIAAIRVATPSAQEPAPIVRLNVQGGHMAAAHGINVATIETFKDGIAFRG